MRYNLKDRIAHPFPEDMHLWQALDKLNVQYEKMAATRPSKDRRQSAWIVPAKVKFDQANWGVVLYKENYYIKGGGKRLGFSKGSLKIREEMLQYMTDHHIPVLEVGRTWTTQEMEVYIRTWYNKIKQELKGG